MTTLDAACEVFAMIPDAVALIDDRARIAYANPVLEALVGYGRGRLIGVAARTILPNGSDATACVTAGGHVFPVAVRRAAVVLDGGDYTICVVHDRRDELLARADLYAESHTDALTGLGNRLVLERRLDALVPDAARDFGGIAILIVDVDHFKEINDRYGHPVGDAVLIHVADRLRASVRPEDTVVRLGGDEFAVVSENVDPAEAEALGSRVLAAMDEPVKADGHLLAVALSVGVAAATRADASGQALLAASDRSLYEAKRTGRGRCGPVIDVSAPAWADAGPARPTIDLRDAR